MNPWKNFVRRIADSSLFARIMVAFVFFTILPLNIFYFVSITTTQRSLTRTLQEDTLASLHLVSQSVNNLLDRMVATALFLDQDQTVNELLFADEMLTVGNRFEALLTINRVNTIMQNMMFTAIDAKGYITLVLPDEIVYTNYPYTMEDRARLWDLYQQIDPDGANYIQWTGGERNYVTSERALNPNVITIEKAIVNNDAPGEFGWLAISLFESEFRNLLSDQNADHLRLLVDDDGVVMSATDPSHIGARVNGALAIDMPHTESGYTWNELRSERRVVAWDAVPKAGWMVLDVRSDVGITAALRDNQRIYLWVNLICIALFGAIAWAIARSITGPVLQLTRQMQGIDLSPEVEHRNPREFRRNEIGILEKSFHEMKRDIRELIETNKHKEQKKREAELHALQSQISPHFLFNTLNAVRWYSQTNDNSEAAEMVLSLTKLLKMTISHKEEFVTLAHELETVESYVKILRIRHSGAVVLEIEVPEELQHLRIPKLILQPMVENSILHGFDDRSGEKRIVITGTERSRFIELSVCDNGNGIGSEYWKGPLTSSPAKFTGIGLQNVDERIRNHYGSQYGVSVTSKPGRGVCVSITLPSMLAMTTETPHEKQASTTPFRPPG
ncbi:MAG: histidine kinase [Spirochaetales bacterium]